MARGSGGKRKATVSEAWPASANAMGANATRVMGAMAKPSAAMPFGAPLPVPAARDEVSHLRVYLMNKGARRLADQGAAGVACAVVIDYNVALIRT